MLFIDKSTEISQLILSPPLGISQSNFIQHSINTSIFRFIWDNKPDKTKRQVLYQDFAPGGFLAAESNATATWKTVPDYSLLNIGDLTFFCVATMTSNMFYI